MKTIVPEAKPCPFCGHSEIVIEPYSKGKNHGFHLHCSQCIIGYRQLTIHYSLDWLKEKMIEKWNKRQFHPSPVQEVTETEIIKMCVDELLKHTFLMVHSNSYPAEAVPKATILELPALMRSRLREMKGGKKDEYKQIKIGEIFEIEGKKYICGLPKSPNQDVNEHGQIMLTLIDI